MQTDAISRSAAIEALDQHSFENGYDYDKTVELLSELPALDVAPVVRGHWIHDINNLYGCSECRARETMSHKKKKNFCPNCGARMDEKEG